MRTWQWYALWAIFFLNVSAGLAIISDAKAMAASIGGASATLATATVVPADDEDVAVALSAPTDATPALPPGAMTFDDKLEVARAAVNNDSKHVAQVVRDWVESDG